LDQQHMCAHPPIDMAKHFKPEPSLNVDKPVWDIEDISGLLKAPFRVSDVSERMEQRLKLNPTVPKTAKLRLTEVSRVERRRWKRPSEFSRDREMSHGSLKEFNFDNVKHSTLNERAALVESSRCLKCADAPCTKSCPTSIDIKTFIQCISTKNYYGAAKTILNDNPVGLTCGSVCPASELCVGGCNVAGHDKPININGLQEFACAEFMKWRVPQICTVDTSVDPEAYAQPIAIVGAGPSGLACANYLGRLGYKDIVIYEKSTHSGGLSASEIPQFRSHWDGVRWETRLCEDLGVVIKYNCAVGTPELPSIETLHSQGAKAVFVGVGVDLPNRASCFNGLGPEQGVWTSKEFLPRVCGGSKALAGKRSVLPKLTGQVLVLGAGDTAFDCIGSAFRVGAKRVTCVFRKSWTGMRAVCEERDLEVKEFADFVPLCEPVGVQVDGEGKLCAVQFRRYQTEDNDEPEMDDGTYSTAMVGDKEDTFIMRCNAVILCFGCKLSSGMAKALAPLTLEWGNVKINNLQQSVNIPWAFAGGDITGATMTVEAANDGKVAAWGIHSYLQPGKAIPDQPALPLFETAIDQVDISITMAGVKFPNPFGLASAPCCTSVHMIRRAFEAGWGFAVTKTFVVDRDLPVNVSPRIVRATNSPATYGPGQKGFINIELVTEKTAAYWVKGIAELKKDFPDRPIIASVMAANNKKDWQDLTIMSVKAGSDMIELNMSCPHGMPESGMGMECGQRPDVVKQICAWCVEVAEGIPVFGKMTPNVTDVGVLAVGAKAGGAAGVTCCNTILGIMDLDANGDPWPKVGPEKRVTAGGMCGDQNRPITSRFVKDIRSACGPDFAIMGTGGVSSADSTMQLVYLGASVMQICSSIMNQDFTVVNDYITGLQAILYRRARGDFGVDAGPKTQQFQNSWPGNQPWMDKVEIAVDADPYYGDYERKRQKTIRAELSQSGNITDKCCCKMDDISARCDKSLEVPPLHVLVGESHSKITGHTKLSRKGQVVAVIVEDLCIQCGKCYMTCNDNAYQAIIFSENHKARVNPEDCTGCGLCQSVCPVPGCIQYEDMGREFHPHRGIKPVEDRWELHGIFL